MQRGYLASGNIMVCAFGKVGPTLEVLKSDSRLEMSDMWVGVTDILSWMVSTFPRWRNNARIFRSCAGAPEAALQGHQAVFSMDSLIHTEEVPSLRNAATDKHAVSATWKITLPHRTLEN